ncbi:Mrpl38 protein [Piptocephalis cylindrospora]|uniref:Large ribosomal subunit protein uL14m n=1 Tax=Piptocephalis cylindrospora TaxID=1907219 RepID=A0A4P9XZJ0_9FUNG|nr:Mrpl38 protein [Piptocephalis cylindrospora]|eukprot:RKP11837.1 Mrpl38 protein [Piptocephalis cylindrospora]
MIQLKSTLNVIDNSGALIVECIKVLRNAKSAGVGDEIVVAVKKAQPQSLQMTKSAAGSAGGAKLKKGDVRHAVIVRTRKEVGRPDGRYIRFDDNACVMLNSKKELMGSRILSLVSAELRDRKWGKIVALAPRIL